MEFQKGYDLQDSLTVPITSKSHLHEKQIEDLNTMTSFKGHNTFREMAKTNFTNEF